MAPAWGDNQPSNKGIPPNVTAFPTHFPDTSRTHSLVASVHTHPLLDVFL